ncbi:MAG: type II secretion system minor pseudopilin GspK [Nitrospirae bacterium YQR-1]
MNLNRNKSGSVLIITLLITALFVAILVEFAYGVFVKTNVLYNFKDGQNLSLIADSGINLAGGYIKDYLSSNKYTTYASYVIPVAKISGSSGEALIISIFDENSKFNINTIINENGTTNDKALSTFKRLLKAVNLNENIALYIADWIDKDGTERISTSEGQPNSNTQPKNNYFYSVDELLNIPQISAYDYKKLLRYVTVYGDGLININTASKEVLIALDEEITSSTAKKIIEYREKTTPFKATSDIQSVATMSDKGAKIMGKITVKSSAFLITSVAVLRGIQREIHCATLYTGTSEQVKYWKEF